MWIGGAKINISPGLIFGETQYMISEGLTQEIRPEEMRTQAMETAGRKVLPGKGRGSTKTPNGSVTAVFPGYRVHTAGRSGKGQSDMR